MNCISSRVPVGVMVQVKGKPQVCYEILGLALVVSWHEGYFHFEGFSATGYAHVSAPHDDQTHSETVTPIATASAMRDQVMRSVVLRRGQSEFRRSLLEAYGERCAISGCDASAALEAAHIVPYLGPNSNQMCNGLLLRADLHTLFDLGLLAIDSDTMSVMLSPGLAGTAYAEYDGARVTVPAGDAAPDLRALDHHRAWSGL